MTELVETECAETEFVKTECAKTEFMDRIISRRCGTVVTEFEPGFVLKYGLRVRKAEVVAMELVADNTDVPVPRSFGGQFRPHCGEILMTLVPGVCLRDVWDGLDPQSKISICTQVWNFVEEWRRIPKPLELQHLYQCSADGKSGSSVLLTRRLASLREKNSDILSDKALRERICEHYHYSNGRRYTKAELFDMLPRSDRRSVFTHGELVPKNIMVSGSQVTGIIDWETAGWYPEYWEYVALMAPGFRDGDWQSVMTACAPQTWNLEGINAARRVLI